MNFFKSVFAGAAEEGRRGATTESRGRLGAWTGGLEELVKAVSSRSESAMEICRRDLGEFGAGLLQETAALRDALRVLPPIPGHGDHGGRKDAEAQQAGDARADMVRRVIASRDVEEELSWEVDADEEGEREGGRESANEHGRGQGGGGGEEKEVTIGGGLVETISRYPGSTAEEMASSDGYDEDHTGVLEGDVAVAGRDDRVLGVGKEEEEPTASRGEGDILEEEEEEEDVGWDAIEDLGDLYGGGKVCSSGDGLERIDLRRTSAGAGGDEEDLSWDMEEDDEPIRR